MKPLPILAYGHPVLRYACNEVTESSEIAVLTGQMWLTMYRARGCGLAAPQVGRNLRMFLVDSRQTFTDMDDRERSEYFDGDQGIRQAFINPQILERSADTWQDEEGCLSIPGVAAVVSRSWRITISYLDEDFRPHTRSFAGLTARMIQHEYDHIEGILYPDRLAPLSRKLLSGKLGKVRAGKIRPRYPMIFAK